jgi:NADPH-dependent glutamate synthase beta subunit-like oxidoreductase
MIRALKRFASMAARPEIKGKAGLPRGNVAIVGAGPAGLAAAWTLSREGIRVKVFESLQEPGGLLSWAIPQFRLPRAAVREDIDYILQHGMELDLNSHLHPESIPGLKSSYDAVVLACGAAMPKPSDIPGSQIPGVWLGLEFLRRLAFGPAPEILPPVVVVGGGNVATDAARCAVRLASTVSLVYRRDRQDMPAYEEEVDASAAEGIQFLFRARTVSIEGDPQIGVQNIRIQATAPELSGADGKRSFVSLAGTERTLPARTVILAFGQERDLTGWSEALGIGAALNSDDSRFADGIYAAGDMLTGPATIVEAVAGGINCARRILREIFA